MIRAVEIAVWQRQSGWLVILHSDRGCQFVSGDYPRFLNRNTLIRSMSAVGHCGDNAACEGFFGMLNVMRQELICSTTSSDSTIRECDVGLPDRIRRFQPF